MDGLSILIIFLVILALAGVVFYFIYDYLDYKNKTSTDINTANSAITSEGKERLGNLAYVVNQVNTVNDDIYGTLSSNIVFTNSNVNIQSKKTDSLVNSFSSIMSFNNLVSPNNINIFDLPGSPANININLLKRVTATMGLTASNLTPANSAEFCSSSACIKFPDANGNTFLTPLTKDGKVVLDGSIRVNNDMTFGGATGSPSISAVNQNAFGFNSKYVGIGNTNPQYTLDVLGKTGDNLMRLNSTDTITGNSPALLVNASGDLIVSQSIQLKPTASGATAISVFGSSTVPTGTSGIVINPTVSGKGLEIKADDVTIKGNLKIDGNLTTTGLVTFNSNVNIAPTYNLTVPTINGRAPAYAP